MERLRNQLLTTYGAEGVNLISGLAFGIISARALAPEGRGVVAAAWTAVTISLMVSGLGISKSLINRLNKRDNELSSSDYFGGLISVFPVLVVISWLIMFQLTPTFPLENRYLLLTLLCVAVPVMMATEYARAVLRARRRIYFLNSIVAISAVLRVASLGFLWSIDLVSITSVLLIELGYQVFIGIFALGLLMRTSWRVPKFSRANKAIRSMLSYGVGFQAYSLLFNLTSKLNVPALSHFSNDEMTGYFVVGARLAEYVGTFGNQIMFVLVPFLAKKTDKNAVFRYSLDVTRWSTMFLVPVGLALIIAAGWLIPLLYGVSFESAVPPFRIMVIATISATLFQFSGMGSLAMGRLRAVTACAGIGFLVSATLMFVLIPRFGAVGAAIAAATGHILSLFTHVSLLKIKYDIAFTDVLIPSTKDLGELKRRFFP